MAAKGRNAYESLIHEVLPKLEKPGKYVSSIDIRKAFPSIPYKIAIGLIDRCVDIPKKWGRILE